MRMWKWRAAIAAGGLILTTAALAAQDSSDPEAAAPFEGSAIHEISSAGAAPAGADSLALYADQSDGALYFINRESGDLLVQINESWRFFDLIAARWIETDLETGKGPGLEVTANFVTGIGPSGAEPFAARIIVTRAEGSAWDLQIDEGYSSAWAAMDLEEEPHPEAAGLIAMVDSIAGGAVEDFEEQSQIDLNIERHGMPNPAIAAIAHDLPRRAQPWEAAFLISRDGFLDDSVAGDRHYGIAAYVDGQWRLEFLWRQFKCARGGNAGEWQAGLCP